MSLVTTLRGAAVTETYLRAERVVGWVSRWLLDMRNRREGKRRRRGRAMVVKGISAKQKSLERIWRGNGVTGSYVMGR